jgi:dipeptidyl aminopeptidase/acylaminoacyl peptidase
VVRSPEGAETVVAGGPGESAVQPVWDPDGALWFLCDRTNFWSLYRWRAGSEAELVLDVGSDIAGPQWVFGQSRFTLLSDGRIVLAHGRAGADRLAVLDRDGALRELDVPYGTFRYLTAQGTAVVCVAGGPASEPVVLRVDVDGGKREVLRPARDLDLDPAWFSRPEHVAFPTEDRGSGIGEAHALVYPPTNPGVSGPEGICHC